MLEAIRERTQGWLAKAILVLIAVPFALFGIESFLKDAGSNAPIAKVNGEPVSVQEFGNAVQNYRNRLQAEGQKDLSILETPEAKQSVLDRLIAARLLNEEAKQANFRVSDEQLSKYIISMPEFQDKGQFSQDRYNELLKQNNLSSSRFEKSVRMDMLTQQARDGLSQLAYAANTVTDNAVKIEKQEREVSVAEIKAADFLPQIKIAPEKVQAYYDAHKDKFKVPEQVKIEFVLLSANALVMHMQVSDDEVKKYYEENASKFQGDEQRRASHILIAFGVNATPEAKANAKKKAEEVLAEVKKSPEKFAELAKKYSQDPGSAEKGGDLGAFGRGAMVKPFEEAVFAMTPGSVSDLVESEFGYHIIKLTEVTGAAQTLDTLKPQIRGELLFQKALAKFTEQAEDFSNKVYEQSGSLKPAADSYGLEVQTSALMSKAEVAKFFKSDKFASAIFSGEVLKDKRNTEAVDLGNNTLGSARVVEYKPAAPRSFDEVKAAIEDVLKLEEASKLAVQKGEAALALLKQGKVDSSLNWIPNVKVTRKNAQALSDLAMKQVFKVDTTKLPGYLGVADDGKGYLLVRVTGVASALPTDDKELKLVRLNVQQALAEEYLASYVKTLKQNAKISINKQLLNAGSNTQ